MVYPCDFKICRLGILSFVRNRVLSPDTGSRQTNAARAASGEGNMSIRILGGASALAIVAGIAPAALAQQTPAADEQQPGERRVVVEERAGEIVTVTGERFDEVL